MVTSRSMLPRPSRAVPPVDSPRSSVLPLRGILAAAALFVGGLVVAQGCSSQGEGERCERKNGDNDCAEGLVCKSGKDLGGNADICCPESGGDNRECNPGAVTTSTTGDTSSSTGDTTSSASGSGSTTASGSTSASTTSSGSTTASSSSGGTGGAGGAMTGSTGTN